MRVFILAIALAVTAVAAHAEDLFEPADYFTLLSRSKLKYSITSEPAKTPVSELTCPRRDASTRVVKHGDTTSLVSWNIAPEAVDLINRGEEPYQAGKYEEAAALYKQALEKDPQAAPAYFVYGDTFLFGARDPKAALEQYQKGIALDPTLPLGHFFAATAYVHMDDKAAAREEIIKALTFHPPYEAIWKIARDRPDYYGIRPLDRHPFEPPAGYLGTKQKSGIDVYGGADGAWLGYAICKAAWANEKKFAKKHKENEWTLEEESACVINQLYTAFNVASKDRTDEAEIVAALPPLEHHLWEVAQANQLDGYILFERIGQRCPLGMSMLDDASLQLVENYIRKYVIVAAE